MQKITPFLWFNNNAEEAINFYISIFKNSKILSVMRYGDAGPGPKGSIMGGSFEIDGNEFKVLNGGPQFTFTPAISFFVHSETQEEIDHLWERLSEGGEKINCGWLKDKFGISWQIIPSILGKYLSDPNPIKSNNVMIAMMQMKKIIIKDLQDAYNKE